MPKTKLMKIPINQLVPADWNYKTDGTDEQIEKLCASIKEDSSAGVLAVRELNENTFEVIDGNHRFHAIKRLKWKKVRCESFGPISKAKAIIISKRRNHQWFDDDTLAFAELLKNDVMEEYDIEDLVDILPISRGDIETLLGMADLDWENYKTDTFILEKTQLLKIQVDDNLMELWEAWCKKCSERGLDNHTDCLSAILNKVMLTVEA